MLFFSQKLLLFFGVVLQGVLISGCVNRSNQVIDIVLYTSIVDDDLIEFYHNLHNPYAFFSCEGSPKSQLRVEVITNTPAPLSDINVHYEKDINPIDTSAFVWAYNSIEIANGLNTSADNKKYFVDDSAMLKSLSTGICEKVNKANQIILFYNYLPTDQSKSNIKSSGPQVPKFEPAQMDILASETFYKLAEAQNLLANELNVNIVDEIIANTLRIFISPENIVQIKNNNQNNLIELPIEDYLQRLYNLKNYDFVNISWNDDLKLLEAWELDNKETPTTTNYLSGRQSFTGYKKNIALYTDTVDKTIELHAKLVENIDMTGNVVLEWKVFLGDIKISSDSSLATLNHT